MCDYLKCAVYSTAYSHMLWHWFRNSSYLSNSAFQFLVSKRDLEICVKNSSVLKDLGRITVNLILFWY